MKNLSVFLSIAILLSLATLSFARGGGGCFLSGTLVSTPAGSIPIENISINQSVLSFDQNGVSVSRVLELYEVERDYYYSILTDSASVNVTAEHPFYIGNDRFIEAQDLHSGQSIYLLENGSLFEHVILSISKIDSPTRAYNLRVDNTHTFFANGFAVHNKGGCFLGNTYVSCPNGDKQISNISVGDSVYSFNENGSITNSSVVEVYTLERSEYYNIKTDLSEVNVTAEHPFFNGQDYTQAQDLHVGSVIYIIQNGSFVPQVIRSKILIQAPVTVYNLHVDGPNTFFANNYSVHNKGGCFLSGTSVLSNSGSLNIEDIKVGDLVYSFDENGKISRSKVEYIYSLQRDYYYQITTPLSSVNVTSEHPFLVGNHQFIEVSNLRVGDTIYMYSNGELKPTKITSIKRIDSPVTVYNLNVENDHTFFANGFAVHNKGGGSSRGSSRSSSPPDNLYYYDCNDFSKNQCCVITSSTYVSPSATLNALNSQYSCKCRVSGTTTWEDSTAFTSRYDRCECSNTQSISYPINPCFNLFDTLCNFPIIIFSIAFFFILFGGKFSPKRSSVSWSSTTSISLSSVSSKSKGVSSLLSQWSKSDQMWLEESIKSTAKTIFLKLQECWSKRDYTEMTPLMHSSLYNQHVAQLESMKLKHEINKLDGLELLDLQVVLVKNYHDKKKDEFVVWLKATAKDTIIDDRTNQMIRGDSGKGTFEEFWSFRRDNDSWKLYLITQPEEGMNIIKAQNFDSISTASMLERQEQKTGGKKASTINVASIREQEVEIANTSMDKIKWKSGRVSRLLNFLSDKDKMWAEEDLKSLVRTMFISLNTSIEACDISKIKSQLDPIFAAKTDLTVSDYKSKNQRLEMRNLAVRDVEIVLVRNYYDNRKDEFVAWVSGQAQGVLVDSKSGSVISGDSFVKDFESFWTFKRSGDQWFLSNVEKGFSAPAYADEENFDEGSDKQLLEWYYTKDRAM